MGLGDASGGEDDASAPGGWRRGGISQLTTPPSTEDARAARKAAKKAQKAASVCKINFAGGSAEQTTTYAELISILNIICELM